MTKNEVKDRCFTNQHTDQPTDRKTDRPDHRVACMWPKNRRWRETQRPLVRNQVIAKNTLLVNIKNVSQLIASTFFSQFRKKNSVC